jgi:hypothetical protein
MFFCLDQDSFKTSYQNSTLHAVDCRYRQIQLYTPEQGHRLINTYPSCLNYKRSVAVLGIRTFLCWIRIPTDSDYLAGSESCPEIMTNTIQITGTNPLGVLITIPLDVAALWADPDPKGDIGTGTSGQRMRSQLLCRSSGTSTSHSDNIS